MVPTGSYSKNSDQRVRTAYKINKFVLHQVEYQLSEKITNQLWRNFATCTRIDVKF